MIKNSFNHTEEVESRIKAIRIKTEDSCDFFAAKEGRELTRSVCCNCKYALFLNDDEVGLCKFKR